MPCTALRAVRRAGLAAALDGRDGVAALEFALVAPVLAIMLLGVYDGSRALVVWQQTENAAQAVAQAAEKLSVTPGVTTTSLTFQQMQNAMTTVFAEMPGLSKGNTKGIYPGLFTVTLSEIVYYPQCKYSVFGGNPNANPPTGCGFSAANPQIPYTYWSTSLVPAYGGQQTGNVLRKCGALTREYPTWDSIPANPPPTRLEQMLDPSNFGNNPIVLSPQIVADVQYQYTPSFLVLLPRHPTITFLASASLSTPFGDNTQIITYTASEGDGKINNCQHKVPPS
jgi:hypothetical protein